MLAAARSEYALAEQQINAAWSNLPDDQRRALLPVQRAWIRGRTADCDLEASGVSADPAEREAARLRCDTRLTRARTAELVQAAADAFTGAALAEKPQYTFQ